MSLPKRVPWEALTELDELCSWIYGDQTDTSSKLLAKHRLCAWQVNTPLPHALESVLSFLNAILLDSNNVSSSSLCQIYAMALIRFVNGLVDPLQQSVFARPIYVLATQIGLPAWIVELRHRSTHEDLPSLEVLREATQESMHWLLNRYFLPTLSPSTSTNLESIEIPSLDPLLIQYKSLLKMGLKDASLQGRNKPELDKLLKGFVAWIADVSALYAADLSVQGTDANAPAQKMKLSTQRFCERLCDRNGLVPLSKSKRAHLNKGIEFPPNLAIWAPLIQYLDQQNDYFVDELLACMLLLVNDSNIAENDPTFSTTIASWVLWVVATLGDESGACRKECIRSLLSGAGPEGGNSIVHALLTSLIAQDTTLGNPVNDLLAAVKPQQQIIWQADSMLALEARQLKLREALLPKTRLESALEPSSYQVAPLDEAKQLPAGWSQIPQSSWVSCPIGTPLAI